MHKHELGEKEVSLKNSKDVIEQLYGIEISRHFPNYELFWKEFIGNPNATGVKPYEYVFPPKMRTEEKTKILVSYEKVQMLHYSLFCHLAGAHFHLDELVNTEKISDSKWRYFRHWEHFEVGYMHLGSAFYMMESLWNIVLKLRSHRKGHGRFGKLKSYLNSKKKDALLSGLDKVSIIETRRDLPVHRGRVFTLSHKGKFYVPLKVDKDMMWSQSAKTTNWRETTVQLRDDIVETEELINELHKLLICEYKDFIIKNNIRIDHGEKT